jgi:hypothetical protein
MKKNIGQLFVFSVVLSTAFYLQGCSQQKHDPSAEDGPQTPQPSAAAAEDAYKNRSMEFPADFPLPRYPNSDLEATQFKRNNTPSHTVMLKTQDNAAQVFRFYTNALKQNGWDIGKVIKNRSYMMLTAAKDGADASVMISETRAGFTAISLYARKK